MQQYITSSGRVAAHELSAMHERRTRVLRATKRERERERARARESESESACVRETETETERGMLTRVGLMEGYDAR